MVDVGNSQFDMMKQVAQYYVKVVEQHPEVGARAMKMIQEWAAQDRSAENENVTKNDFFPCVIRSTKETEFALHQPPAVLTQHGMDKQLYGNMQDSSLGVSPDDFDNAFIHNVSKTGISNIVPNESCVINGILMKLTPISARSTEVTPPIESDVTYTESWVRRWGEARRYTPFTMSSSYLTWVTLFEKMELSWEEAEKRGGFCLLVGTLYRCWIVTGKQEFEEIGVELPLVEFGQGFKDMSPALDGLEAALLNGNLAHGMNPILTMCAANAVASQDPAGNRKLDKSKANGRIDGMVALAMALAVAERGEEAVPVSPWEDPNFRMMG